MSKGRIAIFGAGHIGKAFYQMMGDVFGYNPTLPSFVVDSNPHNDFQIHFSDYVQLDVNTSTKESISDLLISRGAKYVINALPFFLNERLAWAAREAKCHYIDFTEDDIQADLVQKIYLASKEKLTCAVKCGLAPGFVNYIGHDLVNQIYSPETLTVCVGALPRIIAYNDKNPENSYNLTWSIDGLVNQYIRPCRVKRNGHIDSVKPLGNQTKVIIDGLEYEAAWTSGGVGNLVDELSIPNIQYMTLRYPGHFDYIRRVLQITGNDFEKTKTFFKEAFPRTNDDVIVVYAECIGKDQEGNLIRRGYSDKFYGIHQFTAIQSTTAGAGLAILEMILENKISGIVNHSDVRIHNFDNTRSYKQFYHRSK